MMTEFSGAGFKKGPAVAEALAERMLAGDHVPIWIDLHPFRLGRFANGEWQRPWSANESTFSSDFSGGR